MTKKKFNTSIDLHRFHLSLFAVIIGASNPVAIKFAINVGWHPFLLGLYRMGFIGVFFFIWIILLNERFLGPDKNARISVLSSAICKGIGVSLFYSALSLIPASRAIVIATFAPVINLLMIHLFLKQESINKTNIIGIFISFIGVLFLILTRQNHEATTSSIRGDICMIGSIIFHNAMVIYEKKSLTQGANPRQLVFSTNLISIIIFMILISYTNTSYKSSGFTSHQILSYLYLISVTGVFFFYYRRWLIGKVGVLYFNSFSHLGKAISIFFAAIILNETIALSTIVHFVIIITGTLIATRSDKAELVDFPIRDPTNQST